MANSGVQVVKKPKQPFAYQGNQVIINTDRVVMQSKKDSILLFAKEHMSFSCNGSIHFDTSSDDKSYFIINTPKIILGLKKNNKLKTYRKDHLVKLAARIGYKFDPNKDFEFKEDTSEISSKRVFTI